MSQVRCIYRFPARQRLADCTTVNYVFGKRGSGKSTLAEHLLSESLCAGATLGLSQVNCDLDAADALREFKSSAADRAYMLFDDCTPYKHITWQQNLLLSRDYLELLQEVQCGVKGKQCKTTLIVTSQIAVASNTALLAFTQPDHVFVTNLLGREDELRLVHRTYAAHVIPSFADFCDALYSVTMGKFGRCLVIARDALYWYDAKSTTLEPKID